MQPATASLLALAGLLAGCSPSYSPDAYATSAVQQANKVEQGVVAGMREVTVTPSGTAGAVTGGAAGGIAGAQSPGGIGSAFGALGGSLVGGLIGSGVERASGQVRAFEYVVRKTNGELISVTQTDPAPLAIGQKVLVIAGAQARIVPDYTVPTDPLRPVPPPVPVPEQPAS